MFVIKFCLHHGEISWSSPIHQLNSDVLKRHILPRLNTSDFDLSFSFCELESAGQIKDSYGKVLGDFYIQNREGDWELKKPSKGTTPKPDKGKSTGSDESSNNIHKIRKRIENILLEREEKKLWDL